MQKRVAVTGMGALTPLGNDTETTWKRTVSGESGIGQIAAFDPTAFDVHIGGEVRDFNIDAFIHKKEQKKMDRFIHLSFAAAQMALRDAGLEFPLREDLCEKTGAILGVGIGGLPNIESTHETFRQRGPGRISPFFIPSVISNLASGQISIYVGAQGPNYVVTSACASGAHAIGEAAQYIRRGMADIMITGGSESAICPLAIGGFSAMKALSTRNAQPTMASRPFDKDRDGFVLSEGAAVLILEDMEKAKKRGARIYGEVLGYGLSSDAYHMTNPSPGGKGAARAMQMALQESQKSPSDIQYINAHGTSTPVGDEIECQAISSTFKDATAKLWVSSTKSMIGHTLGAAGAIESFYCLKVLETGIVPPTINLDNPSDGCNLDFVPHTAREGRITAVMNNSFGFGGTNACLVFGKV